MKLSKVEVQKKMQTQTINGQVIYYSYAEKSQTTLSMFKNDRLILFNFNTGMLYYINEPKQLPFKNNVPKPKNDTANMNVSIAKNPAGTNDLQIQFVMKNQKNQNINVQWIFTLQNKVLAQQWLKVIQNFKHKKVQQMMEAQQKKKQQVNKDQKLNQSWIHDTLGFGLMEVSKKAQPKVEPKPQPLSPQKKPQNNLNKSQLNQGSSNNITDPTLNKQPSLPKLTQSKIQKQPQVQPQPQPIRESKIDIRQSNLQKNPSTASINNKNLNTSNNQSPSPTKPINESNLKSSKYIGQSPQRSYQNDARISKMTLRDELQSILQRSHLRQSNLQNSYISQPQQSRISNNNNKKYNPQSDWNLKFLRKQNEQVIMQFQQYAYKSLMSVLKQDQSSKQPLRIYDKNQSIIICVADARTMDAKRLKSQFRNYHFIMQSCKDQFIVGVPLSCLIQYQGLVALVKSRIPQQAPKIQLTQQILLQLKDLQRYTRIKNNILKRALLYDLTQLYQSKDKKLIYINQLLQYLPIHLEQNYRGGLLRPQHLLDNVNQFMQGGMSHEANRQDIRTLQDALKLIQQNVKQLAKQLSTQDIVFANGIQLKNIMHQRGINLKYLSLLYSQVYQQIKDRQQRIKDRQQTNQQKNISIHLWYQKYQRIIFYNNYHKQENKPKKYHINKRPNKQQNYQLKVNNKNKQGNSSKSDQLWKQIAIRFRKQYNTAMSNHDISGTFYLNCLIKLIPGKYDLTKLNDKKIFFKDDSIINKGFVGELLPKIKSYHRFTTQLTDKIYFTCKQEKHHQHFQAIVHQLQLQSKPIPRSFALSKTDQLLKQYMTQFACPSQFDSKSFNHLNLYQTIGQQPPTSASLSITRNYLKWCLQKDKLPRFKQVIQDSLRIIDYWFDTNHIYHCQFLQLLADYCQITGTIDQSIKLIKQSLATCIKNGAGINKNTAYKYYTLAQKQLRAGRKHDSFDNFIKAKNIMQNFNDSSNKYPITLIKLSSLYLNNNDFQNCIIYAKLAIQKFDQLQNNKNSSIVIAKGTYDRYAIKAIQIMTRAYEIQNRPNEFYRIAQLSSVKYNKTPNPPTFQQLVKICLTAVIFKSNKEKCIVLNSLLSKMSQQSQQQVSSQKCLNELMLAAQQYNVMQRFMYKYESLERILSDINSRRPLSNENKQFTNTLKNIVGVVGQDYVYGLVKQKQLE